MRFEDFHRQGTSEAVPHFCRSLVPDQAFHESQGAVRVLEAHPLQGGSVPATARWRCQPWSPTSPSVTQSLGGARRESRGRSPLRTP